MDGKNEAKKGKNKLTKMKMKKENNPEKTSGMMMAQGGNPEKGGS